MSFSVLALVLALVEPVYPDSNSTVRLVPSSQLEVISGSSYSARLDILSALGPKQAFWRQPREIAFRWKCDDAKKYNACWKIELDNDKDLANARVWYFAANEVGFDNGAWTKVLPFANLEVGETYFWRVTAVGRCGNHACSPTHGCAERKYRETSRLASFVTDDQPPRWIRTNGGPGNFRDLGGWKVGNRRRVRQGMIFRSAGLNANSATGEAKGPSYLTVEDLRYIIGVLGVKTDLDLRSDGETAGMTVSPLGKGVRYINRSSEFYKGIFTPEGKRIMAENFRVFCDERNYPILFHCIGGADRTGSLAYVLSGVLGVDRHDLEVDWESTFYPVLPEMEDAWKTQGQNYWRGLHHFNLGFARFGGSASKVSWNERIVLYLLDCGIKMEEIRRFREIMLEDVKFWKD